MSVQVTRLPSGLTVVTDNMPHLQTASLGVWVGSGARDELQNEHGIFVDSVEPDGPADKAGIKSQDVITSINGKQIMKGQDLIDTIAGQMRSGLEPGI